MNSWPHFLSSLHIKVPFSRPITSIILSIWMERKISCFDPSLNWSTLSMFTVLPLHTFYQGSPPRETHHLPVLSLHCTISLHCPLHSLSCKIIFHQVNIPCASCDKRYFDETSARMMHKDVLSRGCNNNTFLPQWVTGHHQMVYCLLPDPWTWPNLPFTSLPHLSFLYHVAPPFHSHNSSSLPLCWFWYCCPII